MKRRDFSLTAISRAGLPFWAQAQGPAAGKKPEEGIDFLSLDKRVPT